MSTFSELNSVRDEIRNLPEINTKPPRLKSMGTFLGRIGYALKLAFREKELFVFALLQWIVVAFTYLLWVQMLDWIPEEVWREADQSDEGSIADTILLLWSLACVGLASFPIGILSGCMGAVHFLHRHGETSTIARCLQLVLPQSWPLWIFHWIDGWITVWQILKRLPKKDEKTTAADRALSEALYYAWKIGVSGILPSLVTGNNLVQSGNNSVIFVKDNFLAVTGLRAGYSLLCWIVGICAYAGAVVVIVGFDIIPESDEVYAYIYDAYLWVAIPIVIATGVVVMFLRPIYVIAICDLYSDHVERLGEEIELPEHPGTFLSALVAFLVLTLLVLTVLVFRNELGITELLSTAYDGQG